MNCTSLRRSELLTFKLRLTNISKLSSRKGPPKLFHIETGLFYLYTESVIYSYLWYTCINI